MSLFGTPWHQILLEVSALIVSKEPTNPRATCYLLTFRTNTVLSINPKFQASKIGYL